MAKRHGIHDEAFTIYHAVRREFVSLRTDPTDPRRNHRAMMEGKGQVVSWYICGAITIVFLGLRLIARWTKIGKISVDDGLLIFATLCLMADLGIQHYMWNHGIADVANITLENTIRVLKMDIPGSVLYITALWTIKVALVLFYKSLTVSGSKLQKGYNVAFILLAATYLVLFFDIFFHCLPLDKRWSVDPLYQCNPTGSVVNFWLTVILNVSTDITIICLPISMVARLKMKRKQKLGVIAVFILGLFVPVASIIRAYYANLGETMLSCTMLMVEVSVALVVACLPPLRAMVLGRNSQTGSATYGRHYELSNSPGQSRVVTIGASARRSSGSQDGLVHKTDFRRPDSALASPSGEKQRGIVVNTTIDVRRSSIELETLHVI